MDKAGNKAAKSISQHISMPVLSVISFLILIIIILSFQLMNQADPSAQGSYKCPVCPVCHDSKTERDFDSKLQRMLQDMAKGKRDEEKMQKRNDVVDGAVPVDPDAELAPTPTPENNHGEQLAVVSGRSKCPLMGNDELREYDDGCKDGYHISHLLSSFMDIDFIDFVQAINTDPANSKVIDIGIFEAGGIIGEAKKGFPIYAYEASPLRYRVIEKEVKAQPQGLQDKLHVFNYAIGDSKDPLCFQEGGLDGHMYPPQDGQCYKEKSTTVNMVPIGDILKGGCYFLKIDTQGFDSRILSGFIDYMEKDPVDIPFVQFEFTPHFERTRANRTKEDHKAVFRRLIDLGYELFQGAALQPRGVPKKSGPKARSPLAIVGALPDMPTCVDEFVEKMHDGRPGFKGAKPQFGTWMDILAVKRRAKSPHYRWQPWMWAKHM